MFEEAQLYAPVTTAEDGSVTVHLADDHPGFADPDYRARRNHIASLAVGWTPDQPVPRVRYTDEELKASGRTVNQAQVLTTGPFNQLITSRRGVRRRIDSRRTSSMGWLCEE